MLMFESKIWVQHTVLDSGFKHTLPLNTYFLPIVPISTRVLIKERNEWEYNSELTNKTSFASNNVQGGGNGNGGCTSGGNGDKGNGNGGNGGNGNGGNGNGGNGGNGNGGDQNPPDHPR